MEHAVRLHRAYGLSLRETEAMMRTRGVPVSHEALRSWIARIPDHAGPPLFEPREDWEPRHEVVFVNGLPYHLWVARTAGGEALDLVLQPRPSSAKAARRLEELIRGQVLRAAEHEA
jgi:transposase-like protein